MGGGEGSGARAYMARRPLLISATRPLAFFSGEEFLEIPGEKGGGVRGGRGDRVRVSGTG